MRCLAFVFSFFAMPLWAGDPILLNTLDLRTSIPAPPWTVTERIAQDSESLREMRLTSRGTDAFLRAYVPKGQSFDAWAERYDVRAETPVSGDAELHRNALAMRYQRMCRNAILAPVAQSPERQVFVLFCPAFLAEPDTGELVVTVTERRGDTLVQVSYQQRVPAYDVNDRASFPKTTEELRALVRYLNAAHLLPS